MRPRRLQCRLEKVGRRAGSGLLLGVVAGAHTWVLFALVPPLMMGGCMAMMGTVARIA